MAELQEAIVIDWTGCSLVEVVPGKVSGVPILKGTRVQADSIAENYENGSPVDEIADNFDIPETTIRELLMFAANKQRPRDGLGNALQRRTTDGCRERGFRAKAGLDRFDYERLERDQAKSCAGLDCGQLCGAGEFSGG